MNAPLKLGYVIRVGHGFVGSFPWRKQLNIFGKVEQATVYESREEADRIADFYCFQIRAGFMQRAECRVVSLIEATL